MKKEDKLTVLFSSLMTNTVAERIIHSLVIQKKVKISPATEGEKLPFLSTVETNQLANQLFLFGQLPNVSSYKKDNCITNSADFFLHCYP